MQLRSLNRILAKHETVYVCESSTLVDKKDEEELE
jgi:hypothetical protein